MIGGLSVALIITALFVPSAYCMLFHFGDKGYTTEAELETIILETTGEQI